MRSFENERRAATNTAARIGRSDRALVSDVVSSAGQPLDRATREAMESRFGHHFGQVRVHTDAQASRAASAMGARAFTHETHVAFATGEYAPQTASGARLLAHELAHVLQQRAGIQANTGEQTLRYERSADEAANATVPQAGRSNATATAQHRAPSPGFSTTQLQAKSDSDIKKTGQDDNEKIEKIKARIEEVFRDIDYFLKVWEIYNPDRATLSGPQERSLQDWLTAHKGWQKSWLIDEFYQFLGHYPVTFISDGKYNPKLLEQDPALVRLQEYLDGKSKTNPAFMDIWHKYDKNKLTGKQEAFLSELQKAGFAAQDFFTLLEKGFYR